MALTIVRTAYSTNLKNSMDFSTGLCDPAGQLVAQGLCLPLHLGSLPDGMAAVLNRYGDRIEEGDVFILNDPYEGGTHLPDIYMYRPIFVEGTLIGFAAAIAHHTDIGGRVAGGNACDSTEIYQEGLRIPPVKLYEAHRPVQALFDVIERNVRVPRNALGDLRAQLAACHIAQREIEALADRMGLRELQEGFGQLMDYAETLTRSEIERFPDGVYTFTDTIDDDGIDPGPIPITVTLTVEGDELTADFEGSAPQVRGAINSAIPFTKSAVYACLRCLMSPAVPTNSGFFRPIHVRAPVGSVVNPVLPAPVAARGLTGFRLANVIMGALNEMVPGRIPACEVGGDTGISIGGYREDRSAFVFLEFLFGSWGGRPDQDGVDGCASIVVNFSNNPAEVVESEYPLEILQYGLVPDTGGPGQFRGGQAVVREYRFTERECTLQIRSDRHRSRPYGLAGGRSGAGSRNVLNPGRCEKVLPAKTLLTLSRGDVLCHTLAGAGGYGPPFRRDPSAVLDDVRNGKVTPEAAERDYGVVIDTQCWCINVERTKVLRE
jgi:N-methylhydantoinase B